MKISLPRVVPITALRQDAAAVIAELQDTETPTIITQRSRAAAVLLNVSAYERLMYEREVLGILAKGETDIRDVPPVEVDRLLSEVDALIDRSSR